MRNLLCFALFIRQLINQLFGNQLIVNLMDKTFLDLSKAFDSISHPTLLHKTKLLGFSAQANTILKSYLENRV